MVFDDYFNQEKYYLAKQEFFNFLKELCNKNYGLDGTSYLIDLIMLDKIDEVLDKYDLNINYFIYWLLVKYATRRLDESILNNPLIKEKNLSSEIKWVSSIIGQIQFKPFVSSLSLKGFPNVKKNKFYNNIYLGKSLGHCHNYSLAFNNPGVTYVTAFIPSWFSEIKVLHTYIENKDHNEIIDVSRNLIFPTNEFNFLVNPEVISRISNKDFQEDIKILKKNPEVKLRDYLVDKNKVLTKIKNRHN